MKFNINLEGLKVEEPSIAVDQFSITIDYTVDEFRDMIAAYLDMMPQLIDMLKGIANATSGEVKIDPDLAEMLRNAGIATRN